MRLDGAHHSYPMFALLIHLISGATWPSPLSPEHTMNTVPIHHAPHGTTSLSNMQMPDTANMLAQPLPSVLSSYAGPHGPQYMMPGPMSDPAHAAIFAAAAAAAATAAAQMQARGMSFSERVRACVYHPWAHLGICATNPGSVAATELTRERDRTWGGDEW